MMKRDRVKGMFLLVCCFCLLSFAPLLVASAQDKAKPVDSSAPSPGVVQANPAAPKDQPQEKKQVKRRSSTKAGTPAAKPGASGQAEAAKTGGSKQAPQGGDTSKATPVVKGVSPKVLHFDIPQQLFGEITPTGEARIVAVTGDHFPKDLKDPGEILVTIGPVTATATAIADDQKAFWIRLKPAQLDSLKMGTYPVIVQIGPKLVPVDQNTTNGKVEIEVTRPASWEITLAAVGISAVITFVILSILFSAGKAAFARITKVEGGWIVSVFKCFKWALVDGPTHTISLSRAQFAWWLVIIIFGYLTLFVGRGLTRGAWGFVSLSGFGITFLISLGTLLAAQGTSAIHGNKGAGEVEPKWSDLVVSGEVFALERVQQIAWNIIIGVIFIVIIVSTYTSATSLPTIPPELLMLMGISAAGYIGGKAIRNAGPNITGVVAKPGTTPGVIEIIGENLSKGGQSIKDAGVTIKLTGENKEEFEFKQDKVKTAEDDPKNPDLFARRLQLDAAAIADAKFTAWINGVTPGTTKAKIVVINADGQKATWDGVIKAA